MILELKHITLSFTTHKDSFRILDGLDFSVPEGKIMALIGGNGSGKTTLFNVVSGFQKDFKGDVVFKGKNINKLSSDRISRIGVGRLFQNKPLFQDLSLLENMLIASDDASGEFPFAYLFKKCRIDRVEKEKEEQVRSVFTMLFGDGNKYNAMLHQKGGEFSYGEQRLISLARLFMGNYSLLLLDEPTAGVNPVYIEEIRKMIRHLISQRQATVLLIEHNMPFVNGIADHCALI